MAKVERFLEIEEVVEDDFSLPELIRIRVSSKAEAKSKKRQLGKLMRASRVRARYHIHRHGTPSQSCVVEEL